MKAMRLRTEFGDVPWCWQAWSAHHRDDGRDARAARPPRADRRDDDLAGKRKAAFRDGLAQAAAGDLLVHLFRVRVASMLGLRTHHDAAFHVSELLIGAAVAARIKAGSSEHVHLLAEDRLGTLYAVAIEVRGGIAARVDGETAFAACPLVAILRGVCPKDVRAIGDALAEVGFTLVEEGAVRPIRWRRSLDWLSASAIGCWSERAPSCRWPMSVASATWMDA